MPLTYIFAKRYTQFLLDGSKKCIFANILHAPTAFVTLFYFHSIAIVEQLKNHQRSRKLEVAAKTISINYKLGMRISLALHLVVDTRKHGSLCFVRAAFRIRTGAIRRTCISIMTRRSLKTSKSAQTVFLLCPKMQDSKKTSGPGMQKALSALSSGIATMHMKQGFGCFLA